MKRAFLLIFVASIIILSSSAQIAQKSFKMQDKSRVRCSSYKSKDCKKTDTLVLVIALHWGWGQKELPDYYSKDFLEGFVVPVFSNHKAIIIAPDCPGNSWTEEQSINVVLELRNYYIQKYNIDTNKIVITGFSLGGIGTWYLAMNYSSQFNYAIPIAGYPKKEWLENYKGDIKIIALNSFNDEVIPIEKVETAINYLKVYEKSVQVKTIYGVSHYNITKFIKPVRELFLMEF
jgi:predicted peptidase